MADPDTKTTNIRTFNFLNSEDLKGRTKIKINVNPEEFFNNPLKYIKENLSTILGIHNKNVAEMDYLVNFRNGFQNILAKMRADGSTINNVEVTNYAHEIIQFKKGFTVGKPLKYINNGQDKNDEMSILVQYINCIDKSSLDLDKYENIYTTGVAYTFTISQKKKYDIEEEAPFIYKVLDNDKVFMVYADDTLETELFSCIISKTKNELNQDVDTYTCYVSNGTVYILRYNSSTIDYYDLIETKSINIDQPITEYCLNQSRLGVFEPILSQLNSFNTIRSNQLDDIEQFVNAFLIFINQNAKEVMDNIKDFRDKRVLVVKSNNPQMPADVKTLTMQLDHQNINQLYENSKTDAFNIVGVPMATSNTGQGVSGEAQTYGGGWENAQAISSIETAYIKRFEKRDLKKFIKLCKLDNNSSISSLVAKNIDIKYTINKSNNILVKAQAFKYFIDANFTAEVALELADVCDDPHLIGSQMDEHIAKAKKELMDNVQTVKEQTVTKE